jgi:hypothetical protein
MEASMQGSFDKSGETVKSIYKSWGAGIFLLPGLVLAVLIGVVVTQPNLSTLISEAAQAEFTASGPVDTARSEIAQASKQVRAVNAH